LTDSRRFCRSYWDFYYKPMYVKIYENVKVTKRSLIQLAQIYFRDHPCSDEEGSLEYDDRSVATPFEMFCGGAGTENSTDEVEDVDELDR
jgi:hypothetical protein